MTQHNAVFSNTGLIIKSENEFVKKLFKMGINPLNECVPLLFRTPLFNLHISSCNAVSKIIMDEPVADSRFAPFSVLSLYNL